MMKFSMMILLLVLSLLTVPVLAQPSSVPGPAEVYFSRNISAETVLKLYEKLNFKPVGKVGIKVHFGEKGNKNYLESKYVKPLVEKLGGTLVETNTIYGDNRSNSENHIKNAKEHGWDFAPIDILDTTGEITFPYNGTYFQKIYVGKGMEKYGSFVVISHFKGHRSNGVGGALKNLAMGFGSPSGKKAQHMNEIPEINEKECIKCGLCAQQCPVNAIDKEIKIDKSKCIGCGKCVNVCPQKAIASSSERARGTGFQKKVAEYAHAIHSQYHMTYINVLNRISPDCDCMGTARAPFTDDIGILSSNDPVALDQACYDLVNHQCKSEDAFEKENKISGLPGLIHAEKLGAGTRKYKLIELDAAEKEK